MLCPMLITYSFGINGLVVSEHQIVIIFYRLKNFMYFFLLLCQVFRDSKLWENKIDLL